MSAGSNTASPRSAILLLRVASLLLLLLLTPATATAGDQRLVQPAPQDPLIDAQHIVLPNLASATKWNRVRDFMLEPRNRYSSAIRPLFLWAVELRRKPVAQRLLAINRRINAEFAYAADRDVWGDPDYWATPLESLAKGRMDCEDFASFKLFLANMAGIEYEKLSLLVGRIASTGEIHVVLLARADGRGYVLDNRRADVVGSDSYADFDLLYAVDLEEVRIYRDASRKQQQPAAPPRG
jgi:Bacterial transglutaminase-like cysteine proteinase BTLCP